MPKSKLKTKLISLVILLSFFANTILPASLLAATLNLPQPTQFVPLSGVYSFPVLKGLKFDPANPLQMEFIIDSGDKKEKLSQEEAAKLIRYFLAGLTIPADQLWVNLSPYEKNRIIAPSLEQTEFGEGLLAQDYILKQLSASLMYPESETGKSFWLNAYEELSKITNSSKSSINTFNRIWIVPQTAEVYESTPSVLDGHPSRGEVTTAWVAQAKLKTMLEEDYLALNRNQKADMSLNRISSNLMRQVILPKINADVNSGKNFASLRQIYYSLVLSIWFKKKFQDSIYKSYINQAKTKGIDLSSPGAKEKVYQLYTQAFSKGLYNYTKTDTNPASQQKTKRQYFSGGVGWTRAEEIVQVRQTLSSPITVIGTVNKIDVVAQINGEKSGASSSIRKDLQDAQEFLNDLLWEYPGLEIKIVIDNRLGEEEIRSGTIKYAGGNVDFNIFISNKTTKNASDLLEYVKEKFLEEITGNSIVASKLRVSQSIAGEFGVEIDKKITALKKNTSSPIVPTAYYTGAQTVGEINGLIIKVPEGSYKIIKHSSKDIRANKVEGFEVLYESGENDYPARKYVLDSTEKFIKKMKNSWHEGEENVFSIKKTEEGIIITDYLTNGAIIVGGKESIVNTRRVFGDEQGKQFLNNVKNNKTIVSLIQGIAKEFSGKKLGSSVNARQIIVFFKDKSVEVKINTSELNGETSDVKNIVREYVKAPAGKILAIQKTIDEFLKPVVSSSSPLELREALKALLESSAAHGVDPEDKSITFLPADLRVKRSLVYDELGKKTQLILKNNKGEAVFEITLSEDLINSDASDVKDRLIKAIKVKISSSARGSSPIKTKEEVNFYLPTQQKNISKTKEYLAELDKTFSVLKNNLGDPRVSKESGHIFYPNSGWRIERHFNGKETQFKLLGREAGLFPKFIIAYNGDKITNEPEIKADFMKAIRAEISSSPIKVEDTIFETRRSGVLMHPTSLPADYDGNGNLGPKAYQFVDFLADSGQTIWQYLPVGPTGEGDNSPYNSRSPNAGNVLLISPELLVEEGLIDQADLIRASEIKGGSQGKTADVTAREYKDKILSKAYAKFKNNPPEQFTNFVEKNAYWLEDYALMTVLEKEMQGQPWYQWQEEGYRLHKKEALESFAAKNPDALNRVRFEQFIFDKQRQALKTYANKKGVKLFGDIPLYVSRDSEAVWANPQLFKLDENLKPVGVSGCPPDYFNKDGQSWGHPVYNWKEHQKENFQWWKNRLRRQIELNDYMRVDHFRGLVQYWEIPAGEIPVNGRWIGDVPTTAFFDALRKEFGDLPIIAEDLGVITPDVAQARDENKFPGLRLLQFAFSDAEEKWTENSFLPDNYAVNTVVYTGTHDNNTTVGWFREEANNLTKKRVKEYLEKKGYDSSSEKINQSLMKLALDSDAAAAIFPVQDIIGLGSENRMNLPGEPDAQWRWQMTDEQFEELLGDGGRLRELAKSSGRVPTASSPMAEDAVYGGIDFNKVDVNSSSESIPISQRAMVGLPIAQAINPAVFNFKSIESLTFKIVQMEEVKDIRREFALDVLPGKKALTTSPASSRIGQ